MSRRKFEELTQEEIDARAARIRAEWPDWRWKKAIAEDPPVEVLTIKTDKRRNGETI